MMIVAAMLGWSLGYALAALTRSEEGSALYLPVPRRLRRYVSR